ncbi:MtrAB system histidine kinase MtrB [Mumia zhuanghuii]|uniref:Sensor histidine kinase MtrB n=1 Tax=Mumia zhuanghuii TaxID=2585211 RepID=A0A5C4MP37_9ACTN|nr:MtrAB system histidine kinase MtrB [Mumia zhuanghuii]TNC31235.1 HAMP domain-containing histidine kinase [Mumia zhuanghuii]TNC44904.1 HAMP domain-containing histidine kinase [Mumia zhuanghuii]
MARRAPRWLRRGLLRVRNVLSPVVSLWRRSIQARVVITTMAISTLVIGGVGWLMLQGVADGMVEARRAVALSEARAGFNQAQQSLDVSAVSEASSEIDALRTLVNDLASRSGSPPSYQVMLEGPLDPSGEGEAAFASAGIASPAIPDDLARAVAGGEHAAYTFTRMSIEGTDERSAAIIVGNLLRMPDGDEEFALYYAFPMTDQERTLSLVRNSLLYGGLALVLLSSGVAWLVTRQVVTPVRLARRIAERLADGRLEERMVVRGEDDIARLSVSFNKMAESLQRQIRQLEELSRLQHRFVSDVSHELRTPIATVRMAADVLYDNREHFDPSSERSAELLQTELDRFEALLSDLLEISRFDAGAARLEVEAVDLVDLAERVCAQYAPLAARHGVELEVVNRDGPAVVDADVRRIERIVRNLVANAINYSGSPRVQLLVAHGATSAAIAVRDFGVGLEPGQSQLVFNRFWRADPARERSRGGTGLGLAIALEDAVLHGGWLQAWGEPGEGAQFRLTLPRHAGDDPQRSPLPLVPDAGAGLDRTEGVR